MLLCYYKFWSVVGVKEEEQEMKGRSYINKVRYSREKINSEKQKLKDTNENKNDKPGGLGFSSEKRVWVIKRQSENWAKGIVEGAAE